MILNHFLVLFLGAALDVNNKFDWAPWLFFFGALFWFIQERWKKTFDINIEIGETIYKAKDAIYTIRLPWGFSGNTPEEKKAEIDKRIADTIPIIQRFQDLKYKFMSLYGSHHEHKFQKLDKLFLKINQAKNDLYHPEFSIVNHNLDKEESERELKKALQILHSVDENNSFDKEIREAIKTIEDSYIWRTNPLLWLRNQIWNKG